MKALNYMALLLITTIFAGCAPKPQPPTFYESNELKQLVLDYGNAMNDLAASSLEFGADTETEWAIDTVNQIWKNCQEQPFNFLQYMADIAMMEKFFAYGIDYVPMTFYLSKHHHDKDNLVNYKTMFDKAMIATDSLYHVIKTTSNWHDYFRLHTYSLNLVDLYCAFFDDLNYWEPQSSFASIYFLGIIDDIYTTPEIDPTRYALQIDGSSFYITYCSFLRRFPNYNDDKMIDYAIKIDGYTQPIVSLWESNCNYQEISDSELESFLKTVLPIYTDMLAMMAKSIKG